MKKLRASFFTTGGLGALVVCFTLALAAFAAEPSADAPALPSPASVTQSGADSFVGNLVAKFPWTATVLLVIGALRALCKPLFTFLHEVVKVTPSTKDDELLAKVEASQVLKWIVWALDYVASVKLLHPLAAPPAQPPK